MAKLTFEKALKQLEEIVRELETGDPALERSIQLFEEGMKLSRYCTDQLDETERRITQLVKDEKGRILEKPFGDDGRPSPEA